ncbi:MAG: hypothetical protein LC803_22035 [Acidobacteria bacterium]|nr:hypothetical protein [Acidobacteriota bacterium]
MAQSKSEVNSLSDNINDSHMSSTEGSEALGNRIRTLEEKASSSRVQSISTNPLVLLIMGFLLSGIVGGLLTHYHSIRQQELARVRSFSDELNKLRVQKIGEVWETVDKTEADVDVILDKVNKAPGPGTNNANTGEDVDNIIRLLREQNVVINKNRFWLGEPVYSRIKEYLDINGRYALDKLIGHSGIDLTETLKKREQAKQDIIQIRNMFLKGEPISTTHEL